MEATGRGSLAGRAHPLRPHIGVAGFVVIASAVVLAGCSGGDGGSTCTPGRTVPCSCASGETGTQTCRSDGIYAPCDCGDDFDAGVDAGSPDGALSGGDAGTAAEDSGAPAEDGGGSVEDSGAAMDASTSDGGAADAGTTTTPYSLELPPRTLQGEEEAVECLSIQVPHDAPSAAVSIHHMADPEVRAIAVYREDTPSFVTRAECTPYQYGDDIVYLGFAGEDDVSFPEGKGLSFDAQQWLRVEAHYRNDESAAVAADLAVAVTVTSREVDPVQMTLATSGPVLTFADEEGSLYVPLTLPSSGELFEAQAFLDSRLVSGETHRLFIDDGVDGVSIHTWDMPSFSGWATLDPPYVVQADDALFAECGYHNATEETATARCVFAGYTH
ncbi:MAG: hypothetical protein ACOC97_01680 [Myxococcota bacterium]